MYVESKKHTGAELLRWFQDWPRMRKLTTVMGFFWMPSRNRSFEAFEATKYTLQMSRRMNYESVSHSNKKSLIFKKASTDILELGVRWLSGLPSYSTGLLHGCKNQKILRKIIKFFVIIATFLSLFSFEQGVAHIFT